jgi:hypothetical protein
VNFALEAQLFELLALIEPHYPKAGNGTQPKPMEQTKRTS